MAQFKTAFYKTDFYITGTEARKSHTEPIKYKFTKVSGWGLTVQAPNGDIIEIGLDRRPTRWKITERTTEFLLTLDTYSTRKQAQAALTPSLLAAIADRLKQPNTIAIVNALSDYILAERGETKK